MVGTVLELGPQALDVLAWLPAEALAGFDRRAVLDAARRLDRPVHFDRGAWIESVVIELDRAGQLDLVGLADLYRLALECSFGGIGGLWYFAEKVLGLHVRRDLILAIEDARVALIAGKPVREVLADLEAAGQRARELARAAAAAEAAHPDRRVAR